jgi:potassium voltage-gated channel Eag-related subfamily H protein 8
MKINNTNYKSQRDIANILADTFSKNSSSSNYSLAFQKLKSQKEKSRIKFTSTNTENYNQLFTLSELLEALGKAHDTSVGPDQIHYQFLKHLPNPSLTCLLKIFNDSWIAGNVPKLWREAIVIPIPKPDKNNQDPSSYRPIALTSCLCKTMERMINTRLVWYLESNNLISPFQCGFRHERSTTDHLVRLETFIRDAFVKKEHLVAVFFDLEKAYDTTWKYGILNDLQDLGLKGRLPSFISNFLSNREFKVRVGSTLSDLHQQEMGVPQGSILSVTLFNIKINNITKCLTPGVDCSLYVDDFFIMLPIQTHAYN